ncbi:MAG TPA: hypothetical protein VK625_01770, partial [Flavitalea sp.]|nr:hypothetical protein [Flavitalea sp.]
LFTPTPVLIFPAAFAQGMTVRFVKGHSRKSLRGLWKISFPIKNISFRTTLYLKAVSTCIPSENQDSKLF